MTSGKAPRPKTDAQMGFDLLMELYEKGQTLDTKSQVELVNKFLAVREPGRQVPRWGFFLKANRAERIVNALREGLDDFRDRKRSEEHTSELQSPCNLVCRLLLEKKKKNKDS